MVQASVPRDASGMTWHVGRQHNRQRLAYLTEMPENADNRVDPSWSHLNKKGMGVPGRIND